VAIVDITFDDAGMAFAMGDDITFDDAGFAFAVGADITVQGDTEPPLTIDLISVTSDGPLALVLTFDVPPAGAVLDPASYVLTALDGGVPLVVASVALGTPGPGEVFPKTARLALAHQGTNGKTYSVIVTGVTGPEGEALASNQMPFVAVATRPALVSASGAGQGVTVAFNEPIAPATLGAPAIWAVAPLAAGAHVTVTNVALLAGNQVAVLTTLPDLTTVESYRVTAPATLADPMGNTIAGRNADFLAPRNVEPESAAAWAATGDGGLFDVGAGWFELVPWSPTRLPVALDQLVWISLFSDRRADPDDELPDHGGDPVYRGGWWADTYSGGSFGSKLWLLARSPVNATTLLKVRQYAAEALAWMVDAGLAARVDATAERQDLGRVALRVVITKRDGMNEAVAYPDLWSFLQAA
jgi:phage gp46-like protein